MTINNQALLSLLKKGNEASFKVVYDHFYARLYFFVSEYIPNRDLAENILQDTFLTLWEKKDQLIADTNLNAYLYTVAKNFSLKKLRNDRYKQNIIQTSALSPTELELQSEALRKLDTSELIFEEMEAIISQTLSSLSPQCRLVFEMSRFQDLKNGEIAEKLNISPKTVEGHMTKALKTFKTSLKDYLPLLSFLFNTL